MTIAALLCHRLNEGRSFFQRVHTSGQQGWRLLLDLLFPSRCPVCQTSVATPHTLCRACEQDLPARPDAFCRRCGEMTEQPMQTCSACQDVAWAPDGFYCAFVFEDRVRTLLHAFKYKDQGHLAKMLGGLCWERLGPDLQQETLDVVIPMPLHWRRLWWRRYNQSALLARVLSHHLGKPMDTGGLIRRRNTIPQANLDAGGRRENVRGAFLADARRVQGRQVLLVDDVTTTGATLTAAAFALKHAGARRVVVVVLARALPTHGVVSSMG
ncbi:MAG: ComF family protein [Magnetococcales bacterium]|nr:ComF family protein [Magnetococcales bacterium]